MTYSTREEYVRAMYGAVLYATRDRVLTPFSAELISTAADDFMASGLITVEGTRGELIALAVIRLAFAGESGVSPDEWVTLLQSLVGKGLCNVADITEMVATYALDHGMATGELPAYLHETVARVSQGRPGWADVLAQIKPV